jgi:hypothetical protein
LAPEAAESQPRASGMKHKAKELRICRDVLFFEWQ